MVYVCINSAAAINAESSQRLRANRTEEEIQQTVADNRVRQKLEAEARWQELKAQGLTGYLNEDTLPEYMAKMGPSLERAAESMLSPQVPRPRPTDPAHHASKDEQEDQDEDMGRSKRACGERQVRAGDDGKTHMSDVDIGTPLSDIAPRSPPASTPPPDSPPPSSPSAPSSPPGSEQEGTHTWAQSARAPISPTTPRPGASRAGHMAPAAESEGPEESPESRPASPSWGMHEDLDQFDGVHISHYPPTPPHHPHAPHPEAAQSAHAHGGVEEGEERERMKEELSRQLSLKHDDYDEELMRENIPLDADFELPVSMCVPLI